MRLNLSNVAEKQRVESFLESSPYATFYQVEAWSRVKANWDRDVFYQERGGAIEAAIQVLSVTNAKAGKKMYYAPRGPVCDLNDFDVLLPLIDEVKSYVQEQGGYLLKIDPQVPYDTALAQRLRDAGIPLCYKMYSYVQWPMSMTLPLTFADLDEAIQSFTKLTRKEVRKAYRQNLQLIVGAREDIPEFYRITVEMSERKGVAHRPIDYYYQLYDAFGDHVRMTFAAYEGRKIACSLLLSFNGWAYALYGADTLEVDLGQSYFLDCEEIRYAIETGMNYYDLGGVKSLHPENGLYRFKRKLTNDHVFFWIGNMEFVFDEAAYARAIEGQDTTDYTPVE
ncbi:MAG: peptidoglycan bridge formation glycyltransferase FemA/FemB family protein [Peptoniphilaceae bacterium]|nr:peptidoglycan bridge formation glycyltransferase FemA/FemB family protein [Peptoniphilaceae bacterium]MDY6085148.1 peptidoglycan bridge formation glycyltransferase FemA/FemB family protein [Peptoniphilaceae bacterium]